jgi:demethylmenaquinone methyltransferase / 2-methoxy-6-polyprenyl-1,4-benzoquinol methylase
MLPAPDEKAAAVEAMFDRIAPHYDRMNRLLTLRLDQRWRRLAIELLGVGATDTVVDLGCGTGDMCALAAARGARVIGLDFAAQMLAGARRRRIDAALLRADAAALPVRRASATVVTSAFTLRNFVAIAPVVAEIARVLRPGGRVALLDVDAPSHPLTRWGHALYFRRAVPLLGAILADRAAYAYLPESTAYLPPAPELLRMLVEGGLRNPRKRRLAAGAAQLILAER